MTRPLARRTVLRGLGACLALPWLEAMVPARARAAEGGPPRRLLVWTAPNGVPVDRWVPTGSGTAWTPSAMLQPLADHLARLTVPIGLSSTAPLAAGAVEPHAQASVRYLSGQHDLPWATDRGGAWLTIDQLVAQAVGGATALPSLELGSEGPTPCGEAQSGELPSCEPYRTLSWRDATTPMPRRVHPAEVFALLFGDPTEPAAVRERRQRYEQTVVDAVLEDAARLSGSLGSDDRHRLDQFLTGVHALEQRLQAPPPAPGGACAPAALTDRVDLGTATTLGEHIAQMRELMVLALACDRTRVITYMAGAVRSDRPFPELGYPESSHWLSHHGGDAYKLDAIEAIGTWYVTRFGELLAALAAEPEGDGSLLDHTVLLFGSPIADPDTHATVDLPAVVVGGSTPAGRGVVRYEVPVPIAELHLDLARAVGVPAERFGHASTEGLGLL
ncbi:MAG: DUF1552 domain-containing protein [Alphaproteobacteria bacterium]|nr:DUF1552 domain-containing protein [Alphaproteobacteria bacterium]